jgi:hypothetical protein
VLHRIALAAVSEWYQEPVGYESPVPSHYECSAYAPLQRLEDAGAYQKEIRFGCNLLVRQFVGISAKKSSLYNTK